MVLRTDNESTECTEALGQKFGSQGLQRKFHSAVSSSEIFNQHNAGRNGSAGVLTCCVLAGLYFSSTPGGRPR